MTNIKNRSGCRMMIRQQDSCPGNTRSPVPDNYNQHWGEIGCLEMSFY